MIVIDRDALLRMVRAAYWEGASDYPTTKAFMFDESVSRRKVMALRDTNDLHLSTPNYYCATGRDIVLQPECGRDPKCQHVEIVAIAKGEDNEES